MELNSTELLGWSASFILVLTIGRQVYKQWKEKTSLGVSKWLYIGQFAAEIGFIIYAWLVRNWVFVVTNVLLLLENIAGLAIVLYHRRKGRKSGKQA